ncbi:MAG TPA: flagellar biosynthesis protein FlhF, partial [Chromatiales bacterium]|nr:flagellar biosynthesis protein FlhF [Chromatiales bacterium]
VRRHLPLAYIGDGQRVPEDIQPARASVLVARAAGLLDVAAPRIAAAGARQARGGVAAHAHV